MENEKDVIKVCCDCSTEFLWTSGEQSFYRERELNPPRRCRNCREIKRGRRLEPDWRR